MLLSKSDEVKKSKNVGWFLCLHLFDLVFMLTTKLSALNGDVTGCFVTFFNFTSNNYIQYVLVAKPGLHPENNGSHTHF